ncbi:MAG TPA: DUF1592 domain-containing protein [Isosphaeraceae bacterium]|nr:DUF1592 domain-containing protein [Isosphaeraceae bacterium]
MVALAFWVATAAGARAGEPGRPDFGKDVAPLLAKYCAGCHDAKKPRGGIDLTSYKDAGAVARDRKAWERVFDQLEGRDMPPADRPQPTEPEYETLTRWLKAELDASGCNGKRDPGRVTLRRLNRNEYNNTIRDLVGLDLRPADDFPSDDVGYGFDNIGDVLSLPPILMERYLSAAEKVAEKAIVADPKAEVPVKVWKGAEIGGGSDFNDGAARALNSEGEVGVSHQLLKNGTYFVRVRAFGQQAGPEPARMAIKLDGKTIKAVEVKAKAEAPGTYTVRIKAHAGARRFAAAFLNDYYKPDDPDPKKRDRNLIVESLELRGPTDGPPTPLPASHRAILFRMPKSESDRRECARAILKKFADRAYRRPATVEEVDRLLVVFDLAERDHERFERGIQLAVEAALVSPYFLFKVEVDRRRGNRGATPGVAALSDYELASRLSYFLWSSMPDDELFELARKKELGKPEVLASQARRMLKSPKAHALAENFAGQWLQTRNLKVVNPDKGRFPAFDDALRAAMARETELFVRAIVAEDRSVLDFLDADFTFVNERLAKHYGIEGIKGDEFHRVGLKDGRRGGVVTMASVLTVTSNPTRTSPVKRGKWILEQLLGAPPPPPPPDVPDLKEQGPLSGTLRQRMEQHRANALCASCHAKMDPLGFGLENFDAVGAWRDKDGESTVDPSGTLPNGQAFAGPAELKKVLKARGAEFERCLAEKLLTYALGRGLESSDRCAVDAIVADLKKADHKVSGLVAAIVTSDPFRFRRLEGVSK